MSYRTRLGLVVRLIALAVLVLGMGMIASAQLQPGSQLPSTQEPATPDDTWRAQQQKEMARKLNFQREQEIKKETDQLLKLATELKQSVDKTTENTMSLDVIKKAEEIEKLAKNVKEKMKGP